MIRSFLIAITLFFSLGAHAAVWDDTNQWSPDWEARYTDWVRSNWNINFFATPNLANGDKNPYYGLNMDCADTVYSMRIIFASQNSLPFIVQDPSAYGHTLSNRMSRWDHEDQYNRVRDFLRYMYDILSTRSLPDDTYPVTVTRETVHSGGLMMTVAANHHSWTIKDILPIGVPYLIFNSTVGSKTTLTLQERQSWPNPGWVFQGDQTPSGNGGFRYWRPVEYLNQPVWKTPGYSEEQYHVPLNSWVKWARGRLALTSEQDEPMMERMLYVVCQGATSRVESVTEALQFLQQHSYACMSADDYDNYSTPSRDERVFDDMIALRKAYADIMSRNGGKNLIPKTKGELDKIYPDITRSASYEASHTPRVGLDSNSYCTFTYASGHTMDIAEFKRRMFLGNISNNPNDTLEYRWGEAASPSSRAQSCPSADVWKPNLNE